MAYTAQTQNDDLEAQGPSTSASLVEEENLTPTASEKKYPVPPSRLGGKEPSSWELAAIILSIPVAFGLMTLFIVLGSWVLWKWGTLMEWLFHAIFGVYPIEETTATATVTVTVTAVVTNAASAATSLVSDALKGFVTMTAAAAPAKATITAVIALE
ncbi:hypothetical protein MMC19_003914 [Ptychographa xylographoides]|nr:hypothetical protein [Ptychographa xylographoides]